YVSRTHIGRPSTNIDRRAPEVLDHAQVHEPTRTESCSASPTSGGPIDVNAAHVTPRKIRRSARSSARKRAAQMDLSGTHCADERTAPTDSGHRRPRQVVTGTGCGFYPAMG